MVQNVWNLNGAPSHVTLPFEYQTPKLSSIQMNPVFTCSIFRWLLFWTLKSLVFGYFRCLSFQFLDDYCMCENSPDLNMLSDFVLLDFGALSQDSFDSILDLQPIKNYVFFI